MCKCIVWKLGRMDKVYYTLRSFQKKLCSAIKHIVYKTKEKEKTLQTFALALALCYNGWAYKWAWTETQGNRHESTCSSVVLQRLKDGKRIERKTSWLLFYFDTYFRTNLFPDWLNWNANMAVQDISPVCMLALLSFYQNAWRCKECIINGMALRRMHWFLITPTAQITKLMKFTVPFPLSTAYIISVGGNVGTWTLIIFFSFRVPPDPSPFFIPSIFRCKSSGSWKGKKPGHYFFAKKRQHSLILYNSIQVGTFTLHTRFSRHFNFLLILSLETY